MKTIAISLQKGGVGKTSIAVSLAAELAKRGNVLLIDADPQGSASAWIGNDTINAELADVLLEKVSLREAITQTGTTGLFLLPSAGLGGSLKAFGENQAKDDPFCLRRLMKEAATEKYQYVVIDLSPAWGALERAAAIATDEIITPVLGDSFAMDGLEIFSENLMTMRKRMESKRPAYNKIVVNAIDGRIKQHGEIVASIKASAAGLKIYELPVDPAFRIAQRKHLTLQSLSTVKPDTRATLATIAEDVKIGV